jgi:hypothetical protein
MIRNDTLENHVRRLRRRVRLLICERLGLFGASVGAVIAAIMVLLSPRYDFLLDYGLWVGVVLLGAMIGAALGWIRRLDDLSVALAADRNTGLRERLSTAVALQGERDLGGMEEAVLSDASGRISSFRSNEVFRRRFGLPHKIFVASLIVLLCVVFLPQLPMFQSKMRSRERIVMRTEGKKLVKLAKDLKKETGDKHEELHKLAQKLDKLGGKMATGRMLRKQAMLKTRKLTEQVKAQQDRLAKERSGGKSLEQARSDMRKFSDKLAEQSKIPSDKELARLASKEGPLTESEQRALEQAVAKYADPNNGLPVPPELGEALAKLAQNEDYRKAAELMQKLAQKLNSGKMKPADREALRKQMEQLAKALKGTDLDKLAKMMRENAEKLAKLSPQELEKMVREMQKLQKMCKLLAKAGGG